MQKKLFMLFTGLLISGAILTMGSCKKDETPVPQAYVPGFSATAMPTTVGGVEALDFYVVCTTDDYELITVKVKYPGGAGDETFTGSGMILAQDEPISFPQFFPKLLGTWTFTIKGNVKTGTHAGTSFSATTTVAVAGK